MSVVRFNRFATLLVILVALIAMTCRPVDVATKLEPVPLSSPEQPTRTPNKSDFCNHGNFSKRSPLICVDPTNLLAPDPSPAIVWDLEDDLNGNPTTKPVRIVWQARTNVTLGIEVKTKGCLTDVKCAGPICTARVVTLNVPPEIRKNPPANKDEYIKHCTYELHLDGQVIDPDFDVNPCCW